jgi:hypothetical protein
MTRYAEFQQALLAQFPELSPDVEFNEGSVHLELALPSMIAREVAVRVGGRIGAGEGAALATLRTRSPAGYDHYLRGNFFPALRSPEGTARAIGEYSEAERLDSGFAAAIGRAAYAYAVTRSNIYDLPVVPRESLVTRGLAVADRALRRDSTSSDAWMARGLIRTNF